MSDRNISSLAEEYGRLIRDVKCPTHCNENSINHLTNLPNEVIIQLHLLQGHFGREFRDNLDRKIAIIHPGTWNKSAGPDFLNATISIDGDVIKGDIELDPNAEDWERHGHGANPNFNRVCLHVTCHPAPNGWFTRNENHQHIPLVSLSADRLDLITGATPASSPSVCPLSNQFLEFELQDWEHLLQTAAAYRLQQKTKQWENQIRWNHISQALYENLATSLGYSQNKYQMQHLACRTPILEISPKQREAILFGCAGFLIPILPQESTQRAKDYHKTLWDIWWKVKDQYEVCNERRFAWNLSSLRPANYPQRRVAALHSVSESWECFEALCLNADFTNLKKLLTQQRHAYWDKHFTLPSKELARPSALIGASRADDFIINYVLPISPSDEKWKFYKEWKAKSSNSVVVGIAEQLIQSPDRIKHLTRYIYQHQGLLQISKDFCHSHNPCPCNLAQERQLLSPKL